jgi:hypothetical protein
MKDPIIDPIGDKNDSLRKFDSLTKIVNNEIIIQEERK